MGPEPREGSTMLKAAVTLGPVTMKTAVTLGLCLSIPNSTRNEMTDRDGVRSR